MCSHEKRFECSKLCSSSDFWHVETHIGACIVQRLHPNSTDLLVFYHFSMQSSWSVTMWNWRDQVWLDTPGAKIELVAEGTVKA